jgi:hypothetical protein
MTLVVAQRVLRILRRPRWVCCLGVMAVTRRARCARAGLRRSVALVLSGLGFVSYAVVVGRRGGSGGERRRRTLTQEARRTTWRVNRRTENIGQGGELECDDARAIEHGMKQPTLTRVLEVK